MFKNVGFSEKEIIRGNIVSALLKKYPYRLNFELYKIIKCKAKFHSCTHSERVNLALLSKKLLNEYKNFNFPSIDDLRNCSKADDLKILKIWFREISNFYDLYIDVTYADLVNDYYDLTDLIEQNCISEEFCTEVYSIKISLGIINTNSVIEIQSLIEELQPYCPSWIFYFYMDMNNENFYIITESLSFLDFEMCDNILSTLEEIKKIKMDGEFYYV